MLWHVALVRTYVLEELGASFIRVARIGELGTTLTVTRDQRMLRLVFLSLRVSLIIYGSNNISVISALNNRA
jgi:hypothetical protein